MTQDKIVFHHNCPECGKAIILDYDPYQWCGWDNGLCEPCWYAQAPYGDPHPEG